MILSPVSGIVTQQLHEPGEVIGSGTALLEVIDIDRVRIQCGITEEELGLVRIGQFVEFRVPAFPAKKFKGSIEKLAWKADPQTRRFTFSVLAKNPGRLLRGGMTAKLTVLSDSQSKPAVPPEALRSEGKVNYVLIPVENRLQRRKVQVLGASSGLLKVSGALKDGELVVISSSRKLKAGQKVTFKSP